MSWLIAKATYMLSQLCKGLTMRTKTCQESRASMPISLILAPNSHRKRKSLRMGGPKPQLKIDRSPSNHQSVQGKDAILSQVRMTVSIWQWPLMILSYLKLVNFTRATDWMIIYRVTKKIPDPLKPPDNTKESIEMPLLRKISILSQLTSTVTPTIKAITRLISNLKSAKHISKKWATWLKLT